MTFVVHSRSVEETEACGEKLGRALVGGEFVGLAGGLGAGKTAFVRGVARGLGVPPEAQVSSPTFAIVNSYAGGRLPFVHADLYRVADAEELYDAGFYDVIASGAVLVVEWIDRVPEVAPPQRLDVWLSGRLGERELKFVARGSAAERLVAAVGA